MSQYFKVFYILVLFHLKYLPLSSQSIDLKEDSIIQYNPSFFSTYSIKDRYSDPYSSLFSNNPFDINSSLLKLGASYDTARVFYINEKMGELNFRPSISIPFDSYDSYNTNKEIKEYFIDGSERTEGFCEEMLPIFGDLEFFVTGTTIFQNWENKDYEEIIDTYNENNIGQMCDFSLEDAISSYRETLSE